MIFLEQVENDFQRSIDEINISMMESITTFLESFQESDYITEKSEDTLMVKIKNFFADLIASFQNFKNSIKIEINKKLRDSTFKNKLRLLYDEAKKIGKRNVEKGILTEEDLEYRLKGLENAYLYVREEA